MLKKSDDNIERFFKKAVTQQDTTFREHDWQKMEKMLDEDAMERGAIRSKQIKQATYSLIAIFIISFSVYFLAFNPDAPLISKKEPSKQMQAAAGVEAPKDEANQKNTTAALLSSPEGIPAMESTELKNTHTNGADANKNDAEEKQGNTKSSDTETKETGIENNPVTKVPALSKETSSVHENRISQKPADLKLAHARSASSNVNKSENAITDLAANNVTSNPGAKDKSLLPDENKENIITSPKQESLVIQKSDSEKSRKAEDNMVNPLSSQLPGKIRKDEVSIDHPLSAVISNADVKDKSLLTDKNDERIIASSKQEPLKIQKSDSEIKRSQQSEGSMVKSGPLLPGKMETDEVSNDASAINGEQLTSVSTQSKSGAIQSPRQGNDLNKVSTSVHKNALAPLLDEKKADSIVSVKEQQELITQSQSPKELHEKVPSRWSVSILAAPDFSSTVLGRYTSPGKSFGIIGEFRFLKRLSLQSGMLRSTKKYEGYGHEYQPPEGYWERRTNGIIPEEIYGSCLVYEIPVILQYTLAQKDKFRITIGAGVSSYLMDNQFYEYAFEDQNPGASPSWSSPETKKYPFKIGHLSVVYERNISKKFAIGFEPYLKVPFAKMGWSDINLFSSGIQINLRYQFLKKTTIATKSRED